MGEAGGDDGLGTASAQLAMDRRQALARGETLPEAARGAALFADVSGFTGLSRAFALQSGRQRGPEALTEVINPIFDQLIGRVHAFGGSVISFAGDAITCWFEEAPGPAAPGASLRALSCAMAIQEAMLPFADLRTPWGATVSLGVKVFVSAGSARRLLVGDPEHRLHDLIVGQTLARAASSKVHVAKGEILVSQEVAEALGGGLRLRAWRVDEASGQRFGLVEGIEAPAEPRPWPDLEAGWLDASALRAWLPRPVFERLLGGQPLAELRRVIPSFVQFEGIDYDGDPEAGVKLDRVARWLQAVADRFDGHLLQLTFGDKGSLALIAFGAPTAHEDDAERAVAAALALREPPEGLGFLRNIRIGLCRGQLWAGCYGAAARNCYGILGEQVNLAARLMTMAAPGSVLISQDLVDAVAETHATRFVREVSMKDGSEPVRVSELLERRAEARSPAVLTTHLGLVGRERELAQLRERLDALEAGESSGVLIEGEAGIGKSRLLAELHRHAEERGIERQRLAGNAIERATPYHAWQPVVRQAFRLDPIQGRPTDEKRVLRALSLLGDEQVERAPLLNPVLGLEFPETELTAAMEARARSEARHALIVEALREELLDEPLLLILDDAHWVDSASWALLLQVQRSLEPLLLVVATRPMSAVEGDGLGAPEDYGTLVGQPGTTRIDLREMAPEETLSLVAQRLGCRELPADLAELIVERANGNPFFSEELGYALRDRGLLRVVDGACLLTDAWQDRSLLDLPDSIHGVITQRIDLLAPGAQLAAKVASVVGRVFDRDTVAHIYPVEVRTEDIKRFLENLESLDITPLESPEEDDRYIFKHALTQDVAYSLLAFAQRRGLHRAMAEWIERENAGALAPHYGLLAHHWERAERVASSVKYLGLAGEQALEDFANQEAVRLLERAIEQSERQSTSAGAAMTRIEVSALQRGRWERQLGDAQFRMGRFAASEAHLRESLRRLGWPVPEEPEGLAIDVGAILAQERWRQVLSESPAAATMDADARERTRLAYRNYDHLIEVAFLNGDPGLTLYCTFKALEMAERLGPSEELAQAYAKISFTLSFVPMIDLARHYKGLALDLIASSQDPIAQANVMLPLGVFTAGIGDWEETESLIGSACEIFERLGNWPRWGLCKQVLLRAAQHQARFEEMRRIAEQHAQFGERHHNLEQQLWGLRDSAQSLLLTSDEAAAAVRLLEQAIALSEQGGEKAALVMSLALIAVAHQRRGDAAAALATGRRALEMAEADPPTSFGQFTTYAALAEAFEGLLEAGVAEAELPELTERACRTLEGYARTFPIGLPRAQLYRGLRLKQGGDAEAAMEAWQASLAEAEQQGSDYEQALTRSTIGRHLPGDDARRREHLEQSARTLEALGAIHELTLTRRALAE